MTVAARLGRPPRVNRELIARAAHEIGLADLTMTAVAARLGVSVTTLYYHVRDRDELRRLAAEYSAASLRVPADVGQHWAAWLAEWAEYARSAFVAQPGLLEQFINGTLGLDRMLPHIEAVIAVMERQGFSPEDAMGAYALVSAVAIGVAATQMRGLALATTPFDEQVATVLVGIAVRHEHDPETVLTALRPAVPLAPGVFLHP
jgi:AcrR family transcriptional regulator